MKEKASKNTNIWIKNKIGDPTATMVRRIYWKDDHIKQTRFHFHTSEFPQLTIPSSKRKKKSHTHDASTAAITHKQILTHLIRKTQRCKKTKTQKLQLKYKKAQKKVKIFKGFKLITLVERSAFSKMGLQENIVTEAWYSETPQSVYLASRKCVKIEKVDKTKPAKPTHLILDLILNAILPSPLIGTHFILSQLPPQTSHTNRHTLSFSS